MNKATCFDTHEKHTWVQTTFGRECTKCGKRRGPRRIKYPYLQLRVPPAHAFRIDKEGVRTEAWTIGTPELADQPALVGGQS